MNPNTTDPLNIINKELPFPSENPKGGIRVVGFNQNTGRYMIQYICWDTGEGLTGTITEMTPFKISYRFNLNNARSSLS